MRLPFGVYQVGLYMPLKSPNLHENVTFSVPTDSSPDISRNAVDSNCTEFIDLIFLGFILFIVVWVELLYF